MRRHDACGWLMPDNPEDGRLTPEDQRAYKLMLDRMSQPLDMPSIFDIMECEKPKGRKGKDA